jgi:hypothetical protein
VPQSEWGACLTWGRICDLAQEAGHPFAAVLPALCKTQRAEPLLGWLRQYWVDAWCPAHLQLTKERV